MTRANLFVSLTEPLRSALTTVKQNRPVLASSRFCSAFQARHGRALCSGGDKDEPGGGVTVPRSHCSHVRFLCKVGHSARSPWKAHEAFCPTRLNNVDGCLSLGRSAASIELNHLIRRRQHAARFDATQHLGAPRLGLGAFLEDQRRPDCAQRHRAHHSGAASGTSRWARKPSSN